MIDYEVLIGDNCEVNKSIASKLNIPLVGCASHRFALGLSDYYSENEPILQRKCIDQNYALMLKLRNVKRLRKRTTLKRVLRNTTRWNSTAAMVTRYFELKDHIQDFKDDPHIIDFLLTS